MVLTKAYKVMGFSTFGTISTIMVSIPSSAIETSSSVICIVLISISMRLLVLIDNLCLIYSLALAQILAIETTLCSTLWVFLADYTPLVLQIVWTLSSWMGSCAFPNFTIILSLYHPNIVWLLWWTISTIFLCVVINSTDYVPFNDSEIDILLSTRFLSVALIHTIRTP